MQNITPWDDISLAGFAFGNQYGITFRRIPVVSNYTDS